MNHAYITPEATLEDLQHLKPHPVFGTPSMHATFRIKLNNSAAQLAEEILKHRTGQIRWHVRSALAQLGLEAFGDEYSECFLRGNRLIMDTHLTDLRVPDRSPTLEALRYLFHTKKKGSFRVAHAGLFPDAARQGKVSFPIEAAYRLDRMFGHEEIEQMLSGSARKWIEDHRYSVPVPETIDQGAYFLGGIDVRGHNGHTVLLDPVVEVDGTESLLGQSQSPILQKKRSGSGYRQVEIKHRGRKAVPVSAVRVTGSVFECINEDSGV